MVSSSGRKIELTKVDALEGAYNIKHQTNNTLNIV